MKEIENFILNESLLNKYIVYKIIKILLTKWENTEAYQLGIIDEKGERTDKKLETSKEKSSYDLFHRFIFRVKRLFEKFLGKSKLAALFSLAVIFKEAEDTGLFLNNLNESNYNDLYHKIKESVSKENKMNFKKYREDKKNQNINEFRNEDERWMKSFNDRKELDKELAKDDFFYDFKKSDNKQLTYKQRKTGRLAVFVIKNGKYIYRHPTKGLMESRPKLIKFLLKQTDKYWTLKNIDTGYLMKLKQLRLENLRNFLFDVQAYDEERPISSGLNWNMLRRQIIKKGSVVIYIPMNRIQYMKSIYNGEKNPYSHSNNYKMKNDAIDLDKYKSNYKY